MIIYRLFFVKILGLKIKDVQRNQFPFLLVSVFKKEIAPIVDIADFNYDILLTSGGGESFESDIWVMVVFCSL